MYNEVKCVLATCDNCGETFTSYHEGWSLFVDKNACHDAMDAEEWFTGHGDPDHDGKHYCPDCHKQHPEIDDKIIVDETRKKEINKQ